MMTAEEMKKAADVLTTSAFWLLGKLFAKT